MNGIYRYNRKKRINADGSKYLFIRVTFLIMATLFLLKDALYSQNRYTSRIHLIEATSLVDKAPRYGQKKLKSITITERYNVQEVLIKCYYDNKTYKDERGSDKEYDIVLLLKYKFKEKDTITTLLKMRLDKEDGGTYRKIGGVEFLEVTPLYAVEVAGGDTVSFKEVGGSAVVDVEVTIKEDIICEPWTSSDYHLIAQLDNSYNKRRIRVRWEAYPQCPLFYCYELEWVYVNDYKGDDTYYSAGELRYYFPYRAMRVRVRTNEYVMPNIFRHGYVIFRVRYVLMEPDGDLVYGVWSLDDNYNPYKREGINTISDLPATVYIFNSEDESHEPGKNYIFEHTADEEGQRQMSIHYYDGNLVKRQQINFFDDDSVHILEQYIYDGLGRRVIDVLPAPVYKKRDMRYEPLWSRNSNGTEYRVGTNYTEAICGGSIVPPMGKQSGSSRYYSRYNDYLDGWENVQDGNCYTPDAEGYPFIMRIPRNAPDNRVKIEGGPLPYTQPGTEHSRRYYYGVPTQSELDIVFGNNAGRNTYYRKITTQDENGNITTDIYDLEGNLVMNRLDRVSTLLEPISEEEISILSDDIVIIEDGINILEADTFYGSHEVSETFVKEGELQHHYSLTIPEYEDTCSSYCFDCRYILSLSIKDECGNIYSDIHRTIPAIVDTVCNEDNTFLDSSSYNLALKEYTFTRKLWLDSTAIEAYFEEWITNNRCIKTYEEFYEEAISELWSCDSTMNCEDGVEGISQLEDACNVTIPSFCEQRLQLMLLDVSPGGQYAKYDVDIISGAYIFSDNLSLFNSGNKLKKYDYINNQQLTAGISLHRYPQYYNKQTHIFENKYYDNEDGNIEEARVKLYSVSIEAGDDLSLIIEENVHRYLIDTTKYWYSDTVGAYCTKPQNLKEEYFIEYFRPEWAKSLVVYHPEFEYYRICVEEVEWWRKNIDGEMMNTFEYDNYLINNISGISSNQAMIDAYITNIVENDPFFVSAAGQQSLSQSGKGLFEWAFTQNTHSCSQYPSAYQIMKDIVTNYEGTNKSLIDIAYSMQYCSEEEPGQLDIINDTALIRKFINLYIIKKQEVIMRYLHIKANEKKRWNCLIQRSDKNPLYNFWKQHTCGGEQYLYQYLYQINHPAKDIEQVSSIEAYTGEWYKDKQCRWCNNSEQPVSQDSIAYPQNFDMVYNYLQLEESQNYDTTFLLNAFNTYVQIYQQTGLCPPAYDLGMLLKELHSRNELLTQTQLNRCNYSGMALFSQLNTSNPVWTPVVGGKVLKATFEPTSYYVELTIDTPQYLTWEYTPLLALQNLRVIGSAGGENTFTMSLWYRNQNNQIAKTIVKGKTNIGINCTFPSVCGPTKVVDDLIYVLNTFAGGTNPVTVGSDISEITGTGEVEVEVIQPNVVQAGNIRMISSTSLPDGQIFVYSIEPVNIDAQCTNKGYIKYYKIEGATLVRDSIIVTFYKDNETLAIYCCKEVQESTCDESREQKIVELSQLLNNILSDCNQPSCGFMSVTIPLLLQSDIGSAQTPVNVEYGNEEIRIIFNKRCELKISKPPCLQHIIGVDSVKVDVVTHQATLHVLAFNHCCSCNEHYQLTIITTGCIELDPCEPSIILSDVSPVEEIVDTVCETINNIMAEVIATQNYLNYLDSLREEFYKNYIARCRMINERWRIRSKSGAEYYTLYYYDDNGLLLQTVPPEGVQKLNEQQVAQCQQYRNTGAGQPVLPQHKLQNKYCYNTADLETESRSPDAGITEKWYDRKLRLILSQNAEQRHAKRYSYIKYDFMNRPVESGTGYYNGMLTSVLLGDSAFIWLSQKRERVITMYDVAYGQNLNNFTQEHLRNRISAMCRDEDGDGDYEHLLLYSYDVDGNVNKLMHHIPMLAPYQNQYKTLEYDYDLLTGKVRKMIYQRNQPDEWIHIYKYNSSNKLTQVYTKFSTEPDLVNDARYNYYLHRPLKRMEIGENQVQGLDYVYTLHGWIKYLNSRYLNGNDIGKDAQNGSNAYVAKDVLNYKLYYYKNDYKPITNLLEINNFPNFTELYNGNISAFEMSEDTMQHIARIFKYDGLNRLKKQNIYFYNNGTYNNSLSYNERYTYDKNGNILTLQRYKSNEQKIDELKYNYYANTNQLSYIEDNVQNDAADYDIDNQTQNNYRYDRVGNLILDRSERIALRWTDYGKLKQIYYVEPFTIAGQTLYLPFTKFNFTYDVLGNRLTKSYYQKDLLGSSLKYTDIYIRDIQGNVIANYQIRNDSLFLIELPIYGAERLGVLRTSKFLKKKQVFSNNVIDLSEILQQLNASEVHPIRPYRRLYELTDWLGNVRVVISDRKYPVSYNPLRYVADVRVVNDYYSFGMNIAGRSYRKLSYRYEFNRQETLSEQNEDLYSFAFREYDGRVGRFWSIDPEYMKLSYLSSYSLNIDNPIYFEESGGRFPIRVHKAIVKEAMIKAGYEKEVIRQVLKGTGRVADIKLASVDIIHLDNMYGFDKIREAYNKAKESFNQNIKEENYVEAGINLHTIADFYSHSNYIDMWVAYKGEIKNIEEIPTFSEAMKDEKFVRFLSKREENIPDLSTNPAILRTGIYKGWLYELLTNDELSHKYMNLDKYKRKGAKEIGGVPRHDIAKKLAEKEINVIVMEQKEKQ